MQLKRPELSSQTIIVLTSLYLLVALNGVFVGRLLQATPDGGVGLLDVTMLAAVFVIHMLLLSVVAWPRVLKPAFVCLILIATAAAYFMQRFGAVMDRHAIASVFESDAREAGEWLNGGMMLWFLGFGVLPSALLIWVKVRYRPFLSEAGRRIGYATAAVVLLLAVAWPQSQSLSALLRNHAELRHFANPFSVLNSTRGYLKHEFALPEGPPAPYGRDARVVPGADQKPILLVLVIGESARSSSFSLAGYARDTNPELQTLPLLKYMDVESCGTNTATSLPCMFSGLGQDHYDAGKARRRENLLDLFMHAGYNVRWRDNNTGSKKIAARATETDLASATHPTWCPAGSCFDEILLENLDQDLPMPAKNTVLVLHMLGSHGPAYIERYPREFARFTPECDSPELSTCERESILNAYDNSILYSDHVLARTIAWLETKTAYQTAMFFASDHGESTGEHGFYLHGAPKFMAPDEQTRIPMLIWLSPDWQQAQGFDWQCAATAPGSKLNHDWFFHTALSLGRVQSSVYEPKLDLLKNCWNPTAMPSSQM
ncbi:phosphoethanolamine transferase [Ahniella affigens]|nr:phosphoethanolamine--lipid A transferase [Ahniella affigens]